MSSQRSAFLNGGHKAFQGQMDDQELQLFGSATTCFGDFLMPKSHRINFSREMLSAEWNTEKHRESQTTMRWY